MYINYKFRHVKALILLSLREVKKKLQKFLSETGIKENRPVNLCPE